MTVRFVVRALVYIYDGDTPDFFHMDHLVDAPMFPFHEYKELVIAEIGYEGLAPGWYSVWAEGYFEFGVNETMNGPDHWEEVHLDKEKWDHATEGDMQFLARPDVDPVMVFYSASPVPDPNWALIGHAKPIGAEGVTHYVWKRLDDDKKTLYQFSKFGERMPTLMDGAYIDLNKSAFVKGLEVVLQNG